MFNSQLVSNPETGQQLKYKKALKLEAEGSILWIVKGETWRNATLADLPAVIEARKKHAKELIPLETANPRSVSGMPLRWVPPVRNQAAELERYQMRAYARVFFAAAQ